MKIIVVSAVNLRKGGTLTILRECLQTLSVMALNGEYRVVALVHDKRLAQFDGIEYIELPWSVRSWFHRLWCEYVTMYGISKRIGEVSLWFSLHDTTPRVKAQRQAVYCHNPFPFFRWKWIHLWLNYRIVSFALFSKWIYRFNQRKNDYILVQQEWLRQAFVSMFGIKSEDIVVAPPVLHVSKIEDHRPHDGIFRFIYPAYPDVHKNMETLCEAARLLEQEVGDQAFQVILTTDVSMNAYGRWLFKKWGDVRSIVFRGFMNQESLFKLYGEADCLVFPSQVETWGLPITEFAVTDRPMLLAEMPYAHETAQGSCQTAFFPIDDPLALKEMMKQTMRGETEVLTPVNIREIPAPVAYGWEQIFSLILYDEDTTTRQVLSH